ncbi:RHS repeat-associated core domain-containing protein [Stenotrophomonas bentonitica]
MSSSSSMLGYNGVLHEATGSWQILGNGYRLYNPVLMRFHSPDDMSPFGKGGLNAYSYCLLDPINHVDPSGHWSLNVFTANLLGFRLRTPLVAQVVAATAASLSAVGIAVASKSDAQRGLTITAAVILGAISLKLGHHAWVKRKPPATISAPVGAPAAAAAPTPLTASAPPMTPTTPVASPVPSPHSTPLRLGSPTASRRSSSSPYSPPKGATHRAQPQVRGANRADLPVPRPSFSPTGLRQSRTLPAASPRVRSASIRSGAARWEEATTPRWV